MVDISGQSARLFSPEDFQRFDKIYAMEKDVLDTLKQKAGTSFDPQQLSLFLNELYPGSNRSVPDPWYGPEEGYKEVYDLIEQTCRAIVKKYSV